jgi:hypothetical protein
MDDNIIPVLGIICLFGLPMVGWILGRMMKHRERMEMLRLGIAPPPDGRGWNRNRGSAWTQPPPPPWAPGPAPVGPAMPNYAAYEDPSSAQCTLRRGITTAAVGFALLIGLSFIGYRGGDGIFNPATIRPGPWLLGGLIPMFVGIAQIIIALMSGAAFSIGRMQPPPGPLGPPPPGQRSYGSAPASQPGPPGPRYEELARPVPPPDRTQ